MKRIAVDIGGTFTDIVYVDEDSARILVDKVRSTPDNIGRAVTDAIHKIQIDVSQVDLFIHGTTAGINTVVQRKGAKVGLITTEGFRDVLEMGRGNKRRLYDYMEKKPTPLVPRHLRMSVHERINHKGEIIRHLEEKEVQEIIERLKDCGVEAIAVCLLHSYANPENERKLGKIISEIWPEATIALSHRVAREVREYERMSTTVINAYIERAVVHYLEGLIAKLEAAGFDGHLLVLGPSGVQGIETVGETAITTLASGPIGGAAGAAHMAGLCGVENVVTMDVGGTSFDVSLINNGLNVETHRMEIMGFPVLMAGVDIRPIGAGGGSIARLDAAGLLTVGPESAGANPGPMAYGMGGNEPTVTDAAIVNGIIDPDNFLGGELRLDMELAQKGIRKIAERLDVGINDAAEGILAIARNNMTTAMMEILIGQGFDPRDFALMPYGGAGGIFAAPLARDMSISRIIIPVSPGTFSAQGILAMNVVHTYSSAYADEIEALEVQDLDATYATMEQRARSMLLAENIPADAIEYSRSLDICYQGQRYYLEVPFPKSKKKSRSDIIREITNSFETSYETRYGHRMNAPLKCVNARIRAEGKIKEIAIPQLSHDSDIPAAAVKKSRAIFLDGQFIESQIYERSLLLWGNEIDGPAVIEESFHTTVLMPGQKLHVDRLGNLIIQTGTGN
jgi:N-methylhydantoinase A